MLRENGDISLLAIRIIHDFLMNETDDALRSYVNNFNSLFKLCERFHDHDVFYFYGINIPQNEDCTVLIHADDKLPAIEPIPYI